MLVEYVRWEAALRLDADELPVELAYEDLIVKGRRGRYTNVWM